MIYCDTSILIAALTPEAQSGAVQDWLGQADGLCISGWVVTEFASALAIKLRRGDLSPAERDAVLAQWLRLRRNHLHVEPVRQGAFALAAQLCGDAASGLRAGDALHLAVAVQGQHGFATLDRVQAEAARAQGLVLAGPGLAP